MFFARYGTDDIDVVCASYSKDDIDVCSSYGMRYMAKTMHAALRAHYPSAPEKDILKVRSLCRC